MATIRPYQSQANSCITQSLTQYQRVMCEMSTGTGKSFTMSYWIHNTPGRHLIVVTGDDLVNQLVKAVESMTGEHVGIERASQHAHDSFTRIVVASIPSLAKTKRRSNYRENHFDYVHYDEFHGAVCNTAINVLDYFKGAKLIGWTATGFRSDKKKLPYDFVAFRYPYRQAVQDGWLVPIVFDRVPLRIDARGVGQSKGDYDLGELDHAIEPYLEACAKEIASRPDGKHLVYLPLIATSIKMTDILKCVGMRPYHVDGTTDGRKRIIDAFTAGEYNVLCNAQVFSTGTDIPCADHITNLRLTKSLTDYIQKMGRVLRPITDIVPALNSALDALARQQIIADSIKPFATAIDPLWLTKKHDICTPPDLITTDPEEARIIKAEYATTGKINLAKSIVLAEEGKNRSNLARELEKTASNKREIDSIGLKAYGIDLSEYKPREPWEFSPISEKQIEWCKRQGIKYGGLSKGMCHYLMDRMIESKQPTPAQIRLLKWKKLYRKDMTKEEAGRVLDAVMPAYKK